MLAYNYFTLAGPSGFPTKVNLVFVNVSAIDISWEDIPCTQKKGEILGYIVAYSVGGSETNLMVKQRRVTITGLKPLSKYSVKVAAVNSNGTGPFCHPVNVSTPPGRYVHKHCSYKNRIKQIVFI